MKEKKEKKVLKEKKKKENLLGKIIGSIKKIIEKFNGNEVEECKIIKECRKIYKKEKSWNVYDKVKEKIVDSKCNKKILKEIISIGKRKATNSRHIINEVIVIFGIFIPITISLLFNNYYEEKILKNDIKSSYEQDINNDEEMVHKILFLESCLLQCDTEKIENPVVKDVHKYLLELLNKANEYKERVLLPSITLNQQNIWENEKGINKTIINAYFLIKTFFIFGFMLIGIEKVRQLRKRNEEIEVYEIIMECIK